MTEFMRPTVTTEEVNDTVARYIVEPLERQLHASRAALLAGRG